MNYRTNNKINLLLVDDDKEDYLIIRSIISKIKDNPFRIEWVGDINIAKKVIEARRHDAYLVDYRLGAKTGLELLKDFNITKRQEPFILLTGAGDEKVEQEAMQMGIADYLVKGSFNPELLGRVIRYSIQRKNFEEARMQELIELNRSKDEFIALASHQLRTPATAVKQYVGMILEGFAGEIDANQRNMLKTAYESNDRQLNIINDILRVAQLDLNKITLRPEPTNMNKLVDDIVSEHKPSFEHRHQSIDFKKPDKPIEARVDAENIRMAISNVVDNASKYTPENKNIAIGLGCSDHKAVVTVRDEGVGIDADDLCLLFNKFTRISNPLSIKVGGSGLGLYWAKEIINLHGGTIKVNSAPQKGTTFIIELPQEDSFSNQKRIPRMA